MKANHGLARSMVGGALLALALAAPARAEKFANQFVEFEKPPGWRCVLEGAEWVCQSTDEAKKRDAIIVMAAKLRGDQDSLDQYLAHLKQPKSYTSVQGKAVSSEVKYANSASINEQAWIDALHKDSELPGFYTRYLATVKEDIGVLVTYSISVAKYAEYQRDFEALTKTLKVFRKPGGLIARDQSLFENVKVPQLQEKTVFPDGPQGGSEQQPQARQPKSGGMDDFTLYLIVGAGLVGFILWRKKMGKG